MSTQANFSPIVGTGVSIAVVEQPVSQLKPFNANARIRNIRSDKLQIASLHSVSQIQF